MSARHTTDRPQRLQGGVDSLDYVGLSPDTREFIGDATKFPGPEGRRRLIMAALELVVSEWHCMIGGGLDDRGLNWVGFVLVESAKEVGIDYDEMMQILRAIYAYVDKTFYNCTNRLPPDLAYLLEARPKGKGSKAAAHEASLRAIWEAHSA